MTLLDLKNSFHALVAEFPWETSDVAQVVLWFNEGQNDAARKSKCLKKYDITSITSTASTQEYSMSAISDYLGIEKQGGVTYDGKRLDPVTMEELDFDNINWRNRTAGTPTRYYRRGIYVGLDSKPAETGKVIGVHYFGLPTVMAVNTSKPFDGQVDLTPYHDLPLLYAIGLAKFAKKQFKTREDALGEYVARLTAMTSEIIPEDDERYSMVGDPFLSKIIKGRHGLS